MTRASPPPSPTDARCAPCGPDAPVVESSPAIALRIHLLRGQRVLLDADLAALYGVATKRLNEQVRRNAERFPPDFAFVLLPAEFEALRSQIATSNARGSGRGGRRSMPFVFTEHGALMAATVLNSPRAIEVSVYVVRAFVRLREFAATHAELARRLDELERKTAALAADHESTGRDTREQLEAVFDALRALMVPPDPPRRPIGFLTPPPDPPPRGTRGRR